MMSEVIEFVRKSLKNFEHNPPDTEFQRGYLAALKVIWIEALKQRNPDTPRYSERKDEP